MLWDLAATAFVLDDGWTTSALVPSPRLTSELTWSLDPFRHLVAEVTEVARDAVFGDLFTRLQASAERPTPR